MIDNDVLYNVNPTESIVKEDNENINRILRLMDMNCQIPSHIIAPVTNFEILNYDNEMKIQGVKKEVEFDQYLEIKNFLISNDFLIDIIKQAIKKVKLLFKNENLKLEIIHDPEIENYTILALKILTVRDVDEVLNLMNELNDWWITASSKVRNKFIIEEEYI